MRLTTVRAVEEADRGRALSTLMLAFMADPVIRWLWPEPDAYLEHFPALLAGFGGLAFDHRTAYVTDDFRGGALCSRLASVLTTTRWRQSLHDRVPEPTRSVLLAIFEQMGASVPPEPHWHLAFVGVDPFWIGNGIGAALLEYTLDRSTGRARGLSRVHQPPQLTLYQRHGFEVVREIRVGDAPPLIPMLRSPH